MVKNIMFVEKGSLDASNYSKLYDEVKNTNVRIVEYEQCMTKPELVSIEDNTTAEETKTQIANETMDKMLEALARFIEDKTSQYVDFEPFERSERHRMMYYGSRESFMANFVEFLNRG